MRIGVRKINGRTLEIVICTEIWNEISKWEKMAFENEDKNEKKIIGEQRQSVLVFSRCIDSDNDGDNSQTRDACRFSLLTWFLIYMQMANKTNLSFELIFLLLFMSKGTSLGTFRLEIRQIELAQKSPTSWGNWNVNKESVWLQAISSWLGIFYVKIFSSTIPVTNLLSSFGPMPTECNAVRRTSIVSRLKWQSRSVPKNISQMECLHRDHNNSWHLNENKQMKTTTTTAIHRALCK